MLRGSRAYLLFLLILVVSLLFIQKVDPVSDQTLSTEYETPDFIPVLSEYTNHSPIEIWSNQDFEDQGWPGNGTADNPYIIEGLNITSDGRCITVFDTTVYYRITNCRLSSFGDRSNAGIRTQNASYGSISNCIIDTHSEGILLGENSNYCNVTNTICYNNLFLGIQINGDHCLVCNNTCFGNFIGIIAGGNQYCIVYENNSTLNHGGISVSSSQFTYVHNNTVVRNFERGLQVGFSEYCIIEQNYVFKSGTDGIFLDHAENCTFIENTVLNNTERGFYIEDTMYCEFQSNLAANNTWEGFWLYDSDSNTFIENTATQNSGAGIGMNIFCSGNRMYLNELSLNIINNGQDYSGANYWDDGVSVGNYWDDYNGRGSYAVGGSGGAYDNYPFSLGVIPYLQHPEDIVVEYGSSSNSIFWDAYDVDPSTYQLYIDEVFQFSDAWNGSPIVIDIYGQGISNHNYTLVVADSLGNSATDTVFVTVLDTIVPSIDDHSNVVLEYGSTGNTITWIANDLDPSNYELYVNGELQLTDTWSNSSISIDIDDLAISVYNFTIVVADGSGNSASDTVLVTVQDTISPLVESPSDIEFEEGETGHNITWVSFDLDPGTYIIYRNAVAIVNEVWNTSQISISLNGLSAGTYNFTLVLFDSSGNTAVDYVIVTVVTSTCTSSTATNPPSTTPTNPDEVDSQMILVIAGLGSVIAVVAVIVVIMFRKGKDDGMP